MSSQNCFLWLLGFSYRHFRTNARRRTENVWESFGPIRGLPTRGVLEKGRWWRWWWWKEYNHVQSAKGNDLHGCIARIIGRQCHMYWRWLELQLFGNDRQTQNIQTTNHKNGIFGIYYLHSHTRFIVMTLIRTKVCLLLELIRPYFDHGCGRAWAEYDMVAWTETIWFACFV